MRIYCIFEDGFLESAYMSKSKAEYECKLISEQFGDSDYEVKVFEEVNMNEC